MTSETKVYTPNSDFSEYVPTVNKMLTHPSSVCIQEAGLQYLMRFLSSPEQDRLQTSMPHRTRWLLFDPMPPNYSFVQFAALHWRALEAIVNAWRNHAQNQYIVQHCLWLLRDFCMNNLENQECVVNFGGLKLVIEELKLNRRHVAEFIPTFASEVLLVLFANSQIIMKKAHDANAVKHLLDVLRHYTYHEDSHNVRERACRTLTCLVDLYPPAKEKLIQLEGYYIMDNAAKSTPSCFDGTITSESTESPQTDDPVIVDSA